MVVSYMTQPADISLQLGLFSQNISEGSCFGSAFSDKAALSILFGRRGPPTSRNWVHREKKSGTRFYLFIFFFVRQQPVNKFLCLFFFPDKAQNTLVGAR